MPDQRLSEHRGELIDRGREIAFSWQGEPYTGYAGDTVASALYASGVRIFSRSFKYHRPRGLLCCGGACPNCLVEVDGVPTVRACMTPIAGGMKVNAQNVWPSLERDALSALTKVTPGFGMQVGFYYKTFIRPRWAWKYYEKFLRSAAGLGKLDPNHRRTRRFEKVHRHVDVLVIGGGKSGLEAAIAAAADGRDVALVDEGLALGGLLAYSGHDAAIEAEKLIQQARDLNVFILQPAFAGGLYEGNLVPVYQGDTMHRFRAAEVVLANGTMEQPLVFAGNDLPGVMLGSAARRLANQYRISPGEQAVVVCADDSGFDAAVDMAAAGVNVVAVADTREHATSEKLAQAGHRAPHRLRAGAGQGLEGRHRHRGRPRIGAAQHRGRPRADVRRPGRPAGLPHPGRRQHQVRQAEARLRARPHPRGRARRGRSGGLHRGDPRQVRQRIGQAVRLLLRGRHHQGRPPVGAGGLRLARAEQALHHRHHGPLPGTHVPPQLGPPHRQRAGSGSRRPAGRRDHRPAAAQPHQLLAAGGPRLRAGEAHRHPSLARRARRQDALGRRLEAPVRLRLARRRGHGGARVARPDRRLHAGQAHRARA